MKYDEIFRNISPLDHRYYYSNKKLFDRLRRYISEEASVLYAIKVEGALLKTHLHFQNIDLAEYSSSIADLVKTLKAAQVYQEEERTQHNIRALVNLFKKNLPSEIGHLVHLGATSVDILDTATALRLKDVTRIVILPQLFTLSRELILLTKTYAETPQVGRTHGQYAVPITLGHSFAEYLSRLGKSIVEIEQRSTDLRGKLAGAVGGYNAMSMLYSDPVAIEKYFLDSLSLKASDHSTQIVEPEYQLRLMLEFNTAFGIIANLADDLRHLQRSEIDEVREHFTSTQVGSSTMPQKRNPWNSEHIKSMWKAFSPRIMTMYMDQISEHQRDLSNSASGRFVFEYIAGFSAAVERMTMVLKTLVVNEAGLRMHVQTAGSKLLAEPVYILLSSTGDTNAHEIVRAITLKAESEGIAFHEALRQDSLVWSRLSHSLRVLGIEDPELFFSQPEHYRGRTTERARDISLQWEEKINRLEHMLQVQGMDGSTMEDSDLSVPENNESLASTE